ncbi:MAG: hypothetical protein IT320_13230 [Anaerolineae bacterium]|nr:hypothetical protein [Anaerolineae bacterium]
MDDQLDRGMRYAIDGFNDFLADFEIGSELDFTLANQFFWNAEWLLLAQNIVADVRLSIATIIWGGRAPKAVLPTGPFDLEDAMTYIATTFTPTPAPPRCSIHVIAFRFTDAASRLRQLSRDRSPSGIQELEETATLRSELLNSVRSSACAEELQHLAATALADVVAIYSARQQGNAAAEQAALASFEEHFPPLITEVQAQDPREVEAVQEVYDRITGSR